MSLQTVQWIACPETAESPIIRKQFTLTRPIRGEIAVTGLGFFTLKLNGHPVTDQVHIPAPTDYEPRDMSRWCYPLFDQPTHRIFYLRLDLTTFLANGANTLELQLGPGWYRQRERVAEGHMSFGARLKAAFELSVESADGSVARICSDGTEKWVPSDITYSNLFIGEVHDARLRTVPHEPEPVIAVAPPEAELTEQTCPPDRVVRQISPKLLYTDGSRRIYDAGENLSGWVAVRADGKPGDEIRLTFAEALKDDDLDPLSTGSDYKGTTRMQLQEDRFICSGQPETFRPQFVWHGFRYFDVTGPAAELTVEEVHTDLAVTSAFECGNPVLNWLFDADIRTELSNIHGCVPSDCPHRERLGYTGDGQITAPTVMTLLDAQGMYRKWIRDILDCQDKLTGHVQHTAPLMGGGGGPGGWGCAMVIVPDEYDRRYDDRVLLAECYPYMQRWVGYLKSHSEHGLVQSEEAGGWCLGEWASLHPVQIPAPYVNSCYFLDTLHRMTAIADRLGYPSDARMYRTYAKVVRDALIRTYRDPATGSFCGGVQAADAFAVWVGLDDDGRAMQNLVQRYQTVHYFDTGFLGTEILIDVLMRHGACDTAYALMTSPEIGSYAHMMHHGLTTIGEYWQLTCSLNHPMYGAPTRHLLDGLLGIRQAADSYGYRDLRIAPQIPAALDHASGAMTLPCGRVSVRWVQSADAVTVDVTLPADKTAELSLYGQTVALHGGENHHVISKPQ